MDYQRTREYFPPQTLGELRGRLFAAPAAGDVGAGGQSYRNGAAIFDQVARAIDAAVKQAAAGHQGAAADATRTFVDRMVAHTTGLRDEADKAHAAVNQASDHYGTARNKMPGEGPDTAPQLSNPVWEGALSVVSPALSYPVRKAAYDGAHQQAVDAMNGYQDGSNQTVGTFQPFASTAPTPPGTKQPPGGGASQFPKGGGGAFQPPHDSATTTPAQANPVPGPEVPATGPGAVIHSPGGGTGAPQGSPGLVAPFTGPPEPTGRVGGRSPLPSARKPLPGQAASTGSTPGGARAPSSEASAWPAAGGGSSTAPYAPYGGVRGGQSQERRRPSWLVMDDPDDFWLGDLPAHAPPVLGEPLDTPQDR